MDAQTFALGGLVAIAIYTVLLGLALWVGVPSADAWRYRHPPADRPTLTPTCANCNAPAADNDWLCKPCRYHTTEQSKRPREIVRKT